jgi:hypothetical protein
MMAVDLLANRTWRDLRVTARAYNLRFNNNLTKAEALQYVRSALLDAGGLRRALHRLNDAEREALMALKARSGSMERWRFCLVYGQIRRYRPWLPDALANPWRRPISLAEKLWFLGLIEVDAHHAVLLPDTVAALLPPVPHPETAVWTGAACLLDSAAIVRDVAAVLGTLLHTPVRLLHGRWLPPYALKAINQRVSLPEDLSGVRSEFQCQRTRFLHYLAQNAGLVSIQNGLLLPSAEAWMWLSLPYAEAHQKLLDAVCADLRAHKPLWEQFRLPPVGAQVWEYLLSLPPGTYTTSSLSAVLQLETLEPFTGTRIRAALLGPLRWLGIGTVDMAAVWIAAPVFDNETSSMLRPEADSVGVTLSSVPPLCALAELLAFATADECGLRVDQACVARAVEAGEGAAHIAHTLVALTGEPLPQEIIEQLNRWEHAARRARIRHTAVLEITDAADMKAVRSDWRLRPLLGEQLSPRHIAVRDEHKLRQRLRRRGYPVLMLRDRKADPVPRLNNDDPAYLWLAVQMCQALAGIIPMPVHIPGAAVHELERILGPRVDMLRSLIEDYTEQVQSVLRGRVEGVPMVMQSDPSRIRAAVEQAITHTSPIRIRYFSPFAGYETERTIEPELIYERSGATYIEAWCNLDDAPRTFRLDRILAVV